MHAGPAIDCIVDIIIINIICLQLIVSLPLMTSVKHDQDSGIPCSHLADKGCAVVNDVLVAIASHHLCKEHRRQ